MGRKRVERLMRETDPAGISPRRSGFTRRDPKATLAPDLVNRDFTAQGPNRLWVTDLTMIPTSEGPLWLSAIRDAFSRRVVAWETSARADADLVLSTLEYALASREIEPGQLIHHADHGCQYTSIKLTTRLLRAGIGASNPGACAPSRSSGRRRRTDTGPSFLFGQFSSETPSQRPPSRGFTPEGVAKGAPSQVVRVHINHLSGSRRLPAPIVT
ncbi:integrase-like protein [Streptomyces brevispora]|uniref:Integrase-like protein n=1 Tax=Streptomyces brevispora TaxID=887462 RepID=A0A561V6W9_9ACTN|nr:integrase-like protein [Streptomyces brevispora]